MRKDMHTYNRCKDCGFHRRVHCGNNFFFMGCDCEPYKGKWVEEIEVCPLLEKIETEV